MRELFGQSMGQHNFVFTEESAFDSVIIDSVSYLILFCQSMLKSF